MFKIKFNESAKNPQVLDWLQLEMPGVNKLYQGQRQEHVQ